MSDHFEMLHIKRLKIVRVFIILHIWQRGPNPPILWRPSILPTPSLFQILSNPPLHSFLSPPTPNTTAVSVILLFWLNGWSRHIWCAILLNDIMDLHISSLSTLVTEGPWCVFYTRHDLYWGLTHNVVFCWYSDLISHTQTHTHTHTNIHKTLRGK